MKHCFSHWTNLRHLLVKKLTSRRGFSLVETLIAAAIILTNLGIISSAVVQYGEVSRKQRIITKAMDVEAAIHGSISNPGNYPGATIDTMISTYLFPDPFVLRITIENTAGFIDATMTNAAPTFSIFLNEKLDNCGSSSFAVKECVIQMEISRAAFTASPNAPSFAYAYRIRINPNINIKVLNLGVNHDQAFSDPSVVPPVVNPASGKNDYNLYVPQFLLLANTQVDCVAGTAGLTGYDSRTGMAQCLKRPVAGDECLSTQIAKGLTTVLDSGTYKMRLICVTTRTLACGQPSPSATFEDYSFWRFDPATLDSDFVPAPVNRCVYTTEDPSASGATYTSAANRNGLTVTSPCPQRYSLQPASNCTVSAVATPNGSCNYCTTGVRDAYGVCSGADVDFFWVSAGYNQPAAAIGNQAYPASTDSINCGALTDNTNLGGYFQCNAPFVNSVSRPASRPATYQFTPTCVLDTVTKPVEFIDGTM